MHMEGESSLRCSCLSSNFSDFIFALHSLTEGDYIYEVFKILQLNGIFNKILIQKRVRIACLFFFCTLIINVPMKKIVFFSFCLYYLLWHTFFLLQVLMGLLNYQL
jgi:hypothetical protein